MTIRMMRRLAAFSGLFMAALLLQATASAATGDKRIALVIGNSAYQHATHLPNPRNDAAAFAQTLRGSDFEVIEGIDLPKQKMEELIDQFTERAYDAQVALIFYAGHGMQVDGNNYLIPVDAELTSAAQLRTRTVQMDSLIKALPIDPAIGIILIDACRDNPLARSFAASLPPTRSATVNSGLAAIQTTTAGDGTGGLLIGYATDPGAVALDGDGQNSPYTSALVRHLATPGVNVQSALTRVRGDVVSATGGRQRPWFNASLGREVFLAGEAAPVPAVGATEVSALAPNAGAASMQPGVAAVQPVDKDWEVETRMWDQVSKANSVEHYRLFIEQFPKSRFRPLAELNMKGLESRPSNEVAALSPAAASTVAPPTERALPTAALTEAIRSTPGNVATEEALNLKRGGLARDLQLRLVSLGYDPKGSDGQLGKNTRSAIIAWQASLGIIQTGYLTLDQYYVLKQQSEPFIAAIYEKQQARNEEQATTSRVVRQPEGRVKPKNKGNGDNAADTFGKVMLGVGAAVLTCKIAGC